MNRKEFIRSCGFACLGITGVAPLLTGCISSKTLGGSIQGDDLVVAVSDFETKAGTEKDYKKYLMVQNDILLFPICIYRHDEKDYSAIWMRCSHQGAELQVFGDRLQCPAHGSEFSNKGAVKNGPADATLRTFPVRLENNQLKISLKAI